jgi:YbgC/YbaW family acyl-CoA thioester hydrolase
MQTYKIASLTRPLFSTILEVRINDINYGNHLGHDALVSLLHEARVRFLKSKGYSEFNVNGLGMLLSNLVVNYFKQAFYADKLVINLEINNISRTKLDFYYQAMLHGTQKEIARAVTTMVFYNYEKSKVAKIPQEFLASCCVRD